MRATAALLLTASGAAFSPDAAIAQTTATGQDPIVVTGENRIICRRVTRTATRMRVGRICRRQSEWAADSGPAGNHSNGDSEEAAQTLDGLRADDVSTGCGYEGHQTPLGPRR